MCTRSGSIDPAVVTYLQRAKGMSPDEIETMLNTESGLRALSGTSGDMREVAAAANAGDSKAMLAAQAFAYQVRKAIGAYVAALGGLDVLVFSGGIGENSPGIRALACQGLYHMGILIDEVRNRQAIVSAGVADITHADSKVRILVAHSNPARMIARETIRVLGYRDISQMMKQQRRPIPVAVSAHHVHLSQAHVEQLFGPGYKLTPRADLSQPGQFACEEMVTLVGPRREIPNVRVLGPVRKQTQVEISRTEEFQLGISAPVRMSGDLDGSPGLVLRGPAGEVKLESGVIIAHRHIHMTPEDAQLFGLQDKDVVMVRVEGARELIFGDVIVRVSPDYALEMHVDTDEGNAAELTRGAIGYLEGIQRRGANE
jgi:acetate kinase